MRGALAFGLLVAGAAARAGEAPPCRVDVALEPTRAVVGQQVQYRARVLLRPDVRSIEWEHPPSFPHLRTEVLPGDPRAERVLHDGVAYHVRDERRALFPERPGDFVLHAPPLRCRTDAGVVRVQVPDVALRVLAPPAAPPPGFSGLVGPLQLSLSVAPQSVPLGGSVRVALMARGTGNLWQLADPYAGADFAGADVFARPDDLVLERGRELFVRRHFALDVVPREAGPLRIPALRVPWFDPETGGYAVAETPAVTVAVGPRQAASPPIRPPAATPASPDRPRTGPSARAWIAGAGLLLAGGALLFWRRLAARRRAVAAARELARGGSGEPALAARSRALRTALARHVADAATASPEELAVRPGLAPAVATAAALLLAVERARFDPAAAPPEAETLARAIAAL